MKTHTPTLKKIVKLLETASNLSEQLNPVEKAGGTYIDYDFQILSNKIRNTLEFLERITNSNNNYHALNKG